MAEAFGILSLLSVLLLGWGASLIGRGLGRGGRATRGPWTRLGLALGGALAMASSLVPMWGLHRVASWLPGRDAGAVVYQSGGLGLMFGAAVMGLVWFIGDRGRGSPRCPRCWYSMSGTEGLTCPECGRTAREPRHLSRPRRDRAFLVAGVVATVVGLHVFLQARMLTVYGWFGAVPTTALVLGWRWLPYEAFVGQPDSVPAGKLDLGIGRGSLHERAGNNDLWGWQAAYLKKTMIKTLLTSDDPGQNSRIVNMMRRANMLTSSSLKDSEYLFIVHKLATSLLSDKEIDIAYSHYLYFYLTGARNLLSERLGSRGGLVIDQSLHARLTEIAGEQIVGRSFRHEIIRDLLPYLRVEEIERARPEAEPAGGPLGEKPGG